LLDCAVWRRTETPLRDACENVVPEGMPIASPSISDTMAVLPLLIVSRRRTSPVLITYIAKPNEVVPPLLFVISRPSVPRPFAEQQVKLPPGVDITLLVTIPAKSASIVLEVIAEIPSELNVPAM